MYHLLKYIRFQSKRILTGLLAIFVAIKIRLSCDRLSGLHTATTSTEVPHWARQSTTTILLPPQQPVSINIPSNIMLLPASQVLNDLFPRQFLTQNFDAFLSFSTAPHIQSILAFYISSIPKFQMYSESRSPWLYKNITFLICFKESSHKQLPQKAHFFLEDYFRSYEIVNSKNDSEFETMLYIWLLIARDAEALIQHVCLITKF
jgi:hypothetical protein